MELRSFLLDEKTELGKALLRKPMVNKPLIRPAISGGAGTWPGGVG